MQDLEDRREKTWTEIRMEQVYQIPVNAARQCATCKNHIAHTLTCKAYPDGIPKKILHGRIDHSKPYEGDNGILYDPKYPEHPETAPYVGVPEI